ncbi:Zinc finger C2H2 type [Ceratocystis lukuohia]|uniref:Zinc finger C2H2 type n=1 Tax=Ceratocystis lukuohia TaxID=2019550 RepID=A0ABR4MSU1_9PEZI
MASTNLATNQNFADSIASQANEQMLPEAEYIDPKLLLSPDFSLATATPNSHSDPATDSPGGSFYQPSMSNLVSDDLDDLSSLNFDDHRCCDEPIFFKQQSSLSSFPALAPDASSTTSHDAIRGRSAVMSMGLQEAHASHTSPHIPSTLVHQTESENQDAALSLSLASDHACQAPPPASQNPHVTIELWDNDNCVSVSDNGSVPISRTRDRSPAPSFASDAATYHDDMSAVYTPSQTGQESLQPQSRLPAASSRRSGGVAPPDRTDEISESINDQHKNAQVRERNESVSQWLQQDIPAFLVEETASSVLIDQKEIDAANDSILPGRKTENKYVPGQTYIDPNNAHLDPTDIKIIRDQPRWEDGPKFHAIEYNRTAPESSKEAMERYRQLLDNNSVLSLAVTVGTTIQHENPSDIENGELLNGNLFKRLHLHKRAKSVNYVFQGFQNIMRNPNTTGNSKRSLHSNDDEGSGSSSGTPTESEARSRSPLHVGRSSSQKKTTPNIGTIFANVGGSAAVIGSTHTRHGSINGPLAPLNKSSLNGLIRRRGYSVSGESRSSESSGLVDLLRKNGGPPVATLGTQTPLPPTQIATSTQLPTSIPAPNTTPEINHGSDDSSDDDIVDDDEENSLVDDFAAITTPSIDGFRDQFKMLNPDILPENEFMIDRVSHQQEQRYKTLVNNRIAHTKLGNRCRNGENCINQGKSITSVVSKSKSAKSGGVLAEDEMHTNTVMITRHKFPNGIPKPMADRVPAVFECHLCFQKKPFHKPSDWTKHVQEDISPFTCTWRECKEPKIFKRKADWVRHENEGHRHLEWWTCNVDDCSHTCYRRDNFLQHLVREHKYSEPQYKTKIQINKYGAKDPTVRCAIACHHETEKLPESEPCRFCNKTFPTWKKLTVHMAKHMEQISLPIINLAAQRDVDENTVISPLHDLPPQAFPTTPNAEEIANSLELKHSIINTLPSCQHQEQQQQQQYIQIQDQINLQPRLGIATVRNSRQFPAATQPSFALPHTSPLPQNGFGPVVMMEPSLGLPNHTFLGFNSSGDYVTQQGQSSPAQSMMPSMPPGVPSEPSLFGTGFTQGGFSAQQQQQQSMEQFGDSTNSLGLHMSTTSNAIGFSLGTNGMMNDQYGHNMPMQNNNASFY